MKGLTDYWAGLLAFSRSVEEGSFTAAARSLNVTPSAVSRAVARLERRVGAILLQRSTRSLLLTQEGRRFYGTVGPALAALTSAEGDVVAGSPLRGIVRLSAPVDVGRLLVASWVQDFARVQPGLTLELNVTDRLIDLRREGVDIAIRLSSPAPVGYVSETVGQLGYAVVASPDYLLRQGRPATPDDLGAHDCLQYQTVEGRPLPWTFWGREQVTTGSFLSDDGGALRTAALNGGGIAYLLRFAVEADLAAGTLIELFPHIPKAELPVQVFHGFGDRIPPRVEAVLAFLKRRLTGSP